MIPVLGDKIVLDMKYRLRIEDLRRKKEKNNPENEIKNDTQKDFFKNYFNNNDNENKYKINSSTGTIEVNNDCFNAMIQYCKTQNEIQKKQNKQPKYFDNSLIQQYGYTLLLAGIDEALNLFIKDENQINEIKKERARVLSDFKKFLESNSLVHSITLSNGETGKYRIIRSNNHVGTLIYFHDNNEDIDNFDRSRFQGYDIIAIEYPGYSDTKFRASEKSWHKNIDEVYESIKKDEKNKDLFENKNIITYGEGLGANEAAAFANKNKEVKTLIINNAPSDTTRLRVPFWVRWARSIAYLGRAYRDVKKKLEKMRPDLKLVVSHDKKDDHFKVKENARKNFDSAASLDKKLIITCGDKKNERLEKILEQVSNSNNKPQVSLVSCLKTQQLQQKSQPMSVI